MGAETTLVWLWLLLLGAVHGINPAMGWLFAVARGLQEEREAAVWQTLLPLAAGHALSIGVVVLAGALAGLLLPVKHLKWVVAACLLVFGICRLLRSRHPVRAGMRVGPRDLVIWSFLMASAHGAGLMVLPVLLRGDEARPAGHAHGHVDHVAGFAAGLPGDQALGLAATLVHTVGYLLVTGLVALIVYRRLGLRLLRTAWINLDLIWGGALILTAVLTPLV
jgi:hypothetical protein